MKGFEPIGFAAGCIVLALGFFAGFFVCAQFAAAQESNQVADPSKTKILDLVFRVDDLGGKVQDLQVKETGQEIRIELAADAVEVFDTVLWITIVIIERQPLGAIVDHCKLQGHGIIARPF